MSPQRPDQIIFAGDVYMSVTPEYYRELLFTRIVAGRSPEESRPFDAHLPLVQSFARAMQYQRDHPVPPYIWSLTPVARNRRRHADNGNIV